MVQLSLHELLGWGVLLDLIAYRGWLKRAILNRGWLWTENSLICDKYL
jgi:hypothetical protein